MTADNQELGRAAGENATCLSLIDGPAIDHSLGSVRHLNGDALEVILMANQVLPNFDPAGYLIARHAGTTDTEVTSLNGPYDFGVAFGGTLVREAIKDRGLEGVVQIPAVPDRAFDSVKPKLIDDYLDKSRELPVGHLIRTEAMDLPDGLVGAINLFAERCRLEVMVGFNFDSYQEEVLRGAYDYLRVVGILENPEAETTRRGLNHMMRRLKGSPKPRQTAA